LWAPLRWQSTPGPGESYDDIVGGVVLSLLVVWFAGASDRDSEFIRRVSGGFHNFHGSIAGPQERRMWWAAVFLCFFGHRGVFAIGIGQYLPAFGWWGIIMSGPQ
jgi:hypothetical protein